MTVNVNEIKKRDALSNGNTELTNTILHYGSVSHVVHPRITLYYSDSNRSM
jgi:hypothetical protein